MSQLAEAILKLIVAFAESAWMFRSSAFFSARLLQADDFAIPFA
jgi:hypothetical protein